MFLYVTSYGYRLQAMVYRLYTRLQEIEVGVASVHTIVYSTYMMYGDHAVYVAYDIVYA